MDLKPITVTVSVEMDINGVPIQRVYEAPATSQMLDSKGGLRVHLHLDGRKLAEVLLPELAAIMRQQQGMRSDFARYYYSPTEVRNDHDDEETNAAHEPQR